MKHTTIKSIVAAALCAVGFSAWADDIYISAGDTLDVGEKLEWLDEGFEFRAAEGGDVSVHNSGSGAYYAPGNSDMEVTAQSIVKTSGEYATVSNGLKIDEIVNEVGGTLQLDGMGEETQVKKIAVGMDGIVQILCAPQEEDKTTVTVTDELTAANGTLLANLKMADGSALLVGGAQKALHMGEYLTMGEGIKLDTATLQALDALKVGESFWLIDAAGGQEINYTGESGEDAWYDSVFSTTSYEGDYTLKGSFNIVIDGPDAFGLKMVAEPTVYAPGSEGNPWKVGEEDHEGDVVAWTNGTGKLVIEGTGAMMDFEHDETPWGDLDITECEIRSGVTSIGSCAFEDCGSLTSVTIPLGVTSIGDCAFEYCSNLKSVTIPSSVTEVEGSAFWGCESLDLVVGNGTDDYEIAFEGDVEVSSVEVKANANVSFEYLSAATIVNAGTVEFGELNDLSHPISNSGTVTVTAYITIVDERSFVLTEGKPGFYDLENNFSSDGNGYFGTLPSFVTVVDGGTVLGEGTVEWEDQYYALNNSGQIQVNDGEVDYETFYVFEDMVKTSDINDDGRASCVEVLGGTLDVDAYPEFEIIVADIATVTGDELDPCAIQIADGAMVNFVEKLEMIDVGVEFRAAEGESVSVYNDGYDTVPYELENPDMEVTAQSIVKTSGEDADVFNRLSVDEIVNEQDYSRLTLSGMGEEAQVKKITVGMDGIVEILRAPYDDEATVTVTDELTADGGTLLANLKMADGSALLVKGEQKALHVGSTLAMGEDIKLDTATLQALDALNVGDSFWLIDAVSGRELLYEGPTDEDTWYDSVFSITSYEGDYTLRGSFNIVFDDMEGFGLKKAAEPVHVGDDAYVVYRSTHSPVSIVITGTGSATGFPAEFYRDDVEGAVVEDGITEIGARFFKDFNNLETLKLGKDVAKVGEKAFLYCMSLESIEIENPNFDLSSLDGAINYHTAVKPDGSLYPIPNVTVKGCQQTLEGKANLTDANWTDLGAVVPGKPMSDYTGYHFFRIVLKKIGE